jgi:GT2 family glycosyltransferase
MTTSSTMNHLPPGARGIRLRDKPAVSVVVASCHEPDMLAACLTSLEDQCARHHAEIIVARAVHGAEVAHLAERFPGVRWVAGDPQADVGQLRSLGLARAHGDIVALTEDHRAVGPNWLEELLEGPRRRGARDGGVDWAAYFAEHGGRGSARDGR